MHHSNISVGLDIGNTKVITCVGKYENGSIDIIGLGQSINQGIRKGVIVDIEETVSAISASLEEAERMSGISIETVSIGISGPFIECEQSRGIIATSAVNAEITYDDVNRAIEAAKAIPSKPNREILHVVPVSFIIDGSETVKDPVGMTGIRLEAVVNIITASSNAVKSIIKTVEQAGLNINEIVFSPLSTSKVLLSKRQIDIGVMLVDIGASTTSYTVFEEGELVTCGVIPIGSMHITNDIAIGLRTNLDLAETVKIKYGYALPDKIPEKEELDLKKIDKNEDGTANLKYISEIIEARINEIFLLIRDNLTRLNFNTALPAGILITGGGAKIKGIAELVKETMSLPCQIAKPIFEISGLIDKCNDPIYSTSIGLMLWKENDDSNNRRAVNFNPSGVKDIIGKFRSTFKNFLP